MEVLATQIQNELENRQVHCNWKNSDLERLPEQLPFVLVVNQELRGIEELLVSKLLCTRNIPFRLLSPEPDLPGFLVPYQVPDAELHGLVWEDAFKKWTHWLEQQPALKETLVVFLEFPNGRFGNARKRKNLESLLHTLRSVDCPICPIRMHSPENLPFNSRINSRLLHLKPGVLNVELRIGNPISVDTQARIEGRDTFRKFLQSKIYALGTSLEVKPFFALPFRDREDPQEPIADPVDPQLIEQDIQSLTFAHLIAQRGEFDILVAAAHEVPNVLQEIGRLRELTFREVGEGTGKARDLDEFDLYYDQLIIWDREQKQLVGGYRMGKGDEIFAKMGVEGFYIHSLFRIQRGFYPIMRKAVELGRSYIVPAYQRKRLPLFLLWKGILHFLLANPQYRYLYGPMSISKHYSNISKSLIVAFIKKYYFDEGLAQFLKPRKPFRAKVEKVDLDVLMAHFGNEMKLLDNFIEDIEPEHFRMPVLMRQYIKLNARFISFNVDPNFSDVLDGFILLDLQDVPYAMIEALKKEGH